MFYVRNIFAQKYCIDMDIWDAKSLSFDKELSLWYYSEAELPLSLSFSIWISVYLAVPLSLQLFSPLKSLGNYATRLFLHPVEGTYSSGWNIENSFHIDTVLVRMTLSRCLETCFDHLSRHENKATIVLGLNIKMEYMNYFQLIWSDDKINDLIFILFYHCRFIIRKVNSELVSLDFKCWPY